MGGPKTPFLLLSSFERIMFWVWLALVWAEKLMRTGLYTSLGSLFRTKSYSRNHTKWVYKKKYNKQTLVEINQSLGKLGANILKVVSNSLWKYKYHDLILALHIIDNNTCNYHSETVLRTDVFVYCTVYQDTYLDVNRLSCTGWPHKQAGLPVLDQHIHEVRVPYSINRRNNNRVERNVFRDWRNIFEFVSPEHPWPRIFFEKAIVIDLPILWKWNWERFGGGTTALVEMVLLPI